MVFRKLNIKTILILSLFAALLLPVPVFATSSCSGADTSILECEGGGDAGIWHILLLTIDIMSIGIGIIALIGILIFGIQYLTAAGDLNKTTKAKRRLYEIVIGLVAWVVLYSLCEWLMPGGKLGFTSDITNISLSLNQSTLEAGKAIQTSVEFTPSDTKDKTYSLSSSNSDIASVVGNTVRCRQEGNATITATSVNGVQSSADITCTKPVEKPKKNSNSTTVHDSALSESEVNDYFSNHPDPTIDDIIALAKEHNIDSDSDDFTAILAWVEGEGQSDPNIAIYPNNYLAYLCANVIINNVEENYYYPDTALSRMPKWGNYYALYKLRNRAESARTNVYTLRALYLAFSYPYPGIHNCWGPGGNPAAPAGTVYSWYDNYGNSVFVVP